MAQKMRKEKNQKEASIKQASMRGQDHPLEPAYRGFSFGEGDKCIIIIEFVLNV